MTAPMTASLGIEHLDQGWMCSNPYHIPRVAAFSPRKRSAARASTTWRARRAGTSTARSWNQLSSPAKWLTGARSTGDAEAAA